MTRQHKSISCFFCHGSGCSECAMSGRQYINRDYIPDYDYVGPKYPMRIRSLIIGFLAALGISFYLWLVYVSIYFVVPERFTK